MTAVEVHVDQGDIDHGVPGSALQCPVAIGLYRATGRSWCVVDATRAVHLHGTAMVRFPPSASAFVVAFDHCEPVHPFTFPIETSLPITAPLQARLTTGQHTTNPPMNASSGAGNLEANDNHGH